MSPDKREEFRSICAKRGFRKDYLIAKELGMCPETFSRKMNGKIPFSLADINTIRTKFSINERKAAELFL